MAKPDRQFWESAIINKNSYVQYYNRLVELAVSMFEWKNLPDTVDERFLELALFGDGMAVFFKDEALGHLALRTMIGGKLNLYQIPTIRTAYASNGYNRVLDESDSVIIFNNLLHTNSVLECEQYARRLANLDRAIDVNANAQKTPVLIRCPENERLTMINLYKKYEGNEPFIFGDKSLNTEQSFGVLNTQAPYVADKLYQLKTEIWNEALTYLGISNTSNNKKERLLTDEIEDSQGGTIASRYSRLNARKQAAEQINKMFGLNIEVDYRADFEEKEEAKEQPEKEEEDE